MSMKKYDKGDEIYYFDRDRSEVLIGTVSAKRWSDDDKVIGYSLQPGDHWNRWIKANQVIGPRTDLTEAK